MILNDGSEVTNHSFEPNSRLIFNNEKEWKKLYSIALKDIKAGEEIVENYELYPCYSDSWTL